MSEAGVFVNLLRLPSAHTYVRDLAGLLALRPADLARTAQERQRRIALPDRALDVQTVETYWVARLQNPWLREPGPVPFTDPDDGYYDIGDPNPEWVPMTDEEGDGLATALQVYSPHLLHSAWPPGLVDHILAAVPRWRERFRGRHGRDGFGELAPVLRVIAGDLSRWTVQNAARALSGCPVRPENAEGRRSGAIGPDEWHL